MLRLSSPLSTSDIRTGLTAIILAVMAITPAPVQAQLSRFRTVQHRSCPAMDSLLGPLSRLQQRAVVMAWYDKQRDVTTLDAGPQVSGHTYMLDLSFHGHDAQPAPAPLFAVILRTESVLDAAKGGAHLSLLLADSLPADTLRLDLGPFHVPSMTGATAPKLPAPVRLTPASFMALARARKATASLDTTHLVFGDSALAEINVMYRVSRCGLAVKDIH